MELTAYATYQQYKQELDTELRKTTEGFVKIGYLLKVAKDTDVLKESGYANVYEFAQAEYNIDKSQVSRFMNINDRFSEDGYSERLREEFRGFGHAKLTIMLQLPDEINEELSPEFTKSEIQAIKEEYDEENKISDLEVLMEGEHQEQKGMDCNLYKVLHQLGKEEPELYVKLFLAGKDATAVQEVLAPDGEKIYSVRIMGVGRLMLSVKDISRVITLTNMRTAEKEEYQWELAVRLIQQLMRAGETPAESWENTYGEKYPEKQEVAPVQPSSKSKEAPKKQTKVSKAVVKLKETPEPPKAEEEPRQQTLHEVDENIPDVPQITVEEIIEENHKEETPEVSQEDAQIPGQTDIEHDFPEYMPAPVDVEECREELVKLWQQTEQATAETSAFFKYHSSDYATTEECTLERLQEVYKHAIDAAAGLEKMIHVKKHIAG